MKPIAEIRARPPGATRLGALRRKDLEALDRILERQNRGVLLVSGVGDGLLTLSTGLAGAAAARGVRTAFLECDLEEPVLAGALGLASVPGLAEYLRKQAEAPQILQPVVLAGPASGAAAGPLVCIVAGAAWGEGPIELGGFRHALAKLRRAYELLVVLGPPLGDESGVLREVATVADLILACVEPQHAAGRSGRRLAKVLKRLSASPAEVVIHRASE